MRSHRLRTLRLAPALVALLALSACDVFYLAEARMPLAAPVSDSCLHSALSRGPEHWQHEHTDSPADHRLDASMYHTPAMFHNSWEMVAQTVTRDSAAFGGSVYRDSSVTLANGVMQVNRRFAPADVTLVTEQLVSALVKVRDACGGRSPDDAPSFAVHVSDTPFRQWTLPGTHGRRAMRVTTDSLRYFGPVPRNAGRTVLHADTLAHDGSGSHWIDVDSLVLPAPPKNTVLATDCRSADAATEGSIVAFVPRRDVRFVDDAVAAWSVVRETMRLRAVPPGDVECEQIGHRAVLAESPRALRRAALTFTPTPGRSRLYVQMGETFMRSTIAVDDHTIGQIAGATFLMVEVAPGPHRVATLGHGAQSVSIDAAADSSYFVELRKKHIGFGAHVSVIDAARGRQVVRASDMLRGG